MDSSAEEKIFNLQLIVQKQEEELLLYRNGTSAMELLELIHEKNVEIETWRAKCEEKDDKLKKLAKTSGDVLLKYERQNEELAVLERERHTLSEALCERDTRIAQLTETAESLRSAARVSEDELGALRLSLWEREQLLTQRESEREAERERERAAWEERLAQALSAQEALSTELCERERALTHTQEALTQRTAELEALQKEVHRWKSYAQDQEASIDKLQKRCATLVGEKSDRLKTLDQERQEMIAHVQQFRESMSQNLSQREEALRRKDEKIRELLLQNKTLQQQYRLQRALSPDSPVQPQQQAHTEAHTHSQPHAVKAAAENPKRLDTHAHAHTHAHTHAHGLKEKRSKPAPLGDRNTNALADLLNPHSPSRVL